MNETTDKNTQNALNHIVLEYLRDQKRQRRWRWLKRLFFIAIMFWIIAVVFSDYQNDLSAGIMPHIGVIDVRGVIADDEEATADNFNKSMEKAYANKGLKAVVIHINSPGGSPVQADDIFNTIRYYRNQYPGIKTYAVCADSCTSAAYYIAAAADEIYANPTSIVGSIGVIYNGFGFVDTLKKVGITRRIHTAGTNKSFLDSFLPEDPVQTQRLQTLLDSVHQQFIKQVRLGRGTRLHENMDTFSGMFWTGAEAIDLGIIDGFANVHELARNTIKISKIVDYTYHQDVFSQMRKGFSSMAKPGLKASKITDTIMYGISDISA